MNSSQQHTAACWVIVATITVLPHSILAQGFEVASIRLSDPDSRGASMNVLKGGELAISGMTIKNLITLSHRIPLERVVGGPKWLDSDKYDIHAKPPAGNAPVSPMADLYPRIQALLADRFHLKVHRESKMVRVYFLTVAKAGLKLQTASTTDSNSKSKGDILPWNLLVSGLSSRLGSPVIDKTGLTGAYHVTLRYTTAEGQPQGWGGTIDSARPEEPGPSIFTAVQEQLGLKLESGKGPVDMLVIDHVERPSEN